MKKIFSTLFIFMGILGAQAQDALTLIAENPDRAANNLHSYEFVEVSDTPAPEGFVPFYISHYGRHGSRYELNTKFSKAAIAGLRAADSLGLLSDMGRQFQADVIAITKAHEEMEGMLTPRGGREHRTIAARMAGRFPQVFASPDRREVSAVSSTVPRCLMSMANFTLSLKEKMPDVDINFTTGEKYMSYIAPSIPYPHHIEGLWDEAVYEEYDFSRFMGQLFTDTTKIREIIPNPEEFVHSAYSTSQICQDLDFLGLDMMRKYFTPEELVSLWATGNDNIYLMWAGSKEYGSEVKDRIKPLVRDIIEKADAAIEGNSHRAADLRFGHDTGVLPLFALLGVDTPDGEAYRFFNAHKNGWYSFRQIPMATNVQFVFYRDSDGTIIVKMLYNEKETMIPGIRPYAGPYYLWNDVKSWFGALCKN